MAGSLLMTTPVILIFFFAGPVVLPIFYYPLRNVFDSVLVHL